MPDPLEGGPGLDVGGFLIGFDDHLILGEGLAIQDQGHEVIGVQWALAEIAQFPGAGLDEAAGAGRGAQSEDRGDRLGTLSVGAAAQAPHNLEEQLPIDLMGLLETLVGAEGDLPILYPVPQPPVENGHLLIG